MGRANIGRATMNLAIFLNTRFYYDGTRYTADERYFEFWTTFTNVFTNVVLCVPLLKTTERKGEFIVDLKEGAVRICGLPYYGSSSDLYRRSLSISAATRRAVSANVDEWDVVGAVVPNLVGLTVLSAARARGKACFAYVRGNHKKTVRYEYEGWKRWLAWLVAYGLDVVSQCATRELLTFVVGGEMYERLRPRHVHAHKVVVSLISRKDLQTAPVARRAHSSALVLLHIGRLSRERGICHLIDAVKLIKDRSPRDVRLVIVGSGSEEEHLRARVRNLGLSDRVIFKGYVPYGRETMELYRDADVFVLPSLTEGVPKVLLESLAQGIPVIATTVGGVPEIVRNEENGILIRPGDPAAIACAVERLMGDDRLRTRIIERAAESVKAYTLEQQRENIVRAMQSHFGLTDLTARSAHGRQ
jgi:glycosyltransferase involved in cell wall biosynthesis